MYKFLIITLFLTSSLLGSIKFVNYTNKSDITDILTTDDAVWIASRGGVVKRDFKGKLLKEYTTADGLPHNEVISITTDDKGNIWFATNGGGIVSFDGKNKWQVYDSLNSGLFNDTILGITYENSTIWTYHRHYRSEGGISKLNLSTNQCELYPINEGVLTWFDSPHSINMVSRKDTLWVPYYRGYINISPTGEVSNHTGETDFIHSVEISNFYFSSQGIPWFTTGGYLINKKSQKWESIKSPHRYVRIYECEKLPNSEDHFAFLLSPNRLNDPDSTHYAGGITFYQNGIWDSIDHCGIYGARYTALAVDKNNQYWVGTDKGLIFGTPQNWTSLIDSINTPPSAPVLNIAEGADDTIWFATRDGVYSFKEGKWENATLTKNYPISYTIFVDSKNRKWFGKDQSVGKLDPEALLCIDGDNWTYYDTTYFQVSHFQRITYFLEDKNHNILVGERYGLIELSPSGNFTKYEFDKYKRGYMRKIVQDSTNHLWAIIRLGFKRLFDDGTTWFTLDETNGIQSGGFEKYSDMMILPDNTKWFVSGKISILKPDSTWEYIDENNGLASNHAMYVVQGNDNDMWVAYGYRYFKKYGEDTTSQDNRTPFENPYLLSHYKNNRWTHYNHKDGTVGQGASALMRDSKGNIWIAAKFSEVNKGITMIPQGSSPIIGKSTVVKRPPVRIANFITKKKLSLTTSTSHPNVILTIYTLTGRKIGTLFSGNLQKGVHTVPTPHISKGHYVVQTKIGGTVFTKRVLVR